MRDRSKNRKPLQRGRISNEAIQAVQALKRAKNEPTKLDGVFAAKVGRLVKSDVVAALRELQNQGEGILALKVFECIRSEHWYKPQASIYADMVGLLASSQLFDEVELLISYLKKENLRPDTEGFNALLKALIDFKFFYLAMECFHLMKVVGCELEESTFKILLNGFELHGQQDLCDIVTEEAQNYFGGSLEFLEEDEQATSRE